MPTQNSTDTFLKLGIGIMVLISVFVIAAIIVAYIEGCRQTKLENYELRDRFESCGEKVKSLENDLKSRQKETLYEGETYLIIKQMK